MDIGEVFVVRDKYKSAEPTTEPSYSPSISFRPTLEPSESIVDRKSFAKTNVAAKTNVTAKPMYVNAIYLMIDEIK